MDSRKLTAAILTYNRFDLTHMMLDQLNSKHAPIDRNVIDNGSTRPYSEYARERGITDAGYLRSDTNLLFSGGWNFAMKQLGKKGREYEWVWMLNNDVIGVTTYMMEYIIANAEQKLGEDINKVLAITPAFNSPHPHHHQNLRFKTLERVSWVDWCVPIVNVQNWHALGGFDTQFKGYGCDLDIGMRAAKAGYRMYVDHRFSVHHLGSQTSISEGANGINDVEQMNTLLKKKYGVNSWTELRFHV